MLGLASTLLLALAGLSFATSSGASEEVAARPAERASVYWGAWIDGDPYRRPGVKLWSDAPFDQRSWDRFERNAGKRVSLIHFGLPAPWTRSFARLPLALTRARGAIPLLDMDTIDPQRGTGRIATLAEIAAGRWDRPLRRWSRAAARYGHPFFLRLNWEMNGRWFRWGREAARSPRAYVRSWRRFHEIAEREGASNITWVWCPNVVFERSTPLRRLYPGDEYVDWTCMDGYNPGHHPLHPIGWQSFAELFATTYEKLLELAPGKPVMIAETGSTELNRQGASSKAQWIRDAFAVQLPRRFPAVKAVAWFNWDIEEGPALRWDWPIESSAAARRAFAKAIASPYYAANRFGELRRGAKIHPLR